jgi:hypothetical protein
MSRKTRDVAGILHFLTPQQMAEEIVRLDAALSARSAEPVKPEPFPRRFLKAIKEMADPEKCWEYGDGDPMADDAALAVQWIEARAALNAAHVLASPVPAGWKLVEDFHVGDRVVFEGVEHVIFALGDRPGTFDIQLPDGKGDRWRNVPPSALKYAPPPLAALFQSRSPE